MPRSDDDVRGRMAQLARDLKSQTDPHELLEHVVASAMDLVPGAQAASVSLAWRHGRIRTSAATDQAIALADEMQVELGEGPCVDAAWEERVVSVPDLRTDDRWPRWSPRIIDQLGFRSMLCLRLFTHEDRVGALNLFSYRAHAFTPDDVDEGNAIAAHAAIAVVAAEKVAGLELALDNRTTIGQATGLTMAYYSLSASQAFQVLRRLSSERNEKVWEIAQRMVLDHESSR